MKALRNDLIRLFEALGWSAASKWGPGKMAGKLKSLVGMAKDGEMDSLEDAGLTELLASVVEADGVVEIVTRESDLDELPTQDGADVSTVEQARKLNHGEDGADFTEDEEYTMEMELRGAELVIEENPEAVVEPDEEVDVSRQKEEHVRPMITKPPKKKRKGKPRKQLSLLSAGIEVLQQSEKPLKVKEILAEVEEQGLWESSKGGKTPEASLAARIYIDIKQKGNDSAFKKVAPGQFRLRK